MGFLRLSLSQVRYKFPKEVSSGARDLIGKLLVAEPLNRLRLQEVIAHHWVKGHVE